MTRSLPRRFHPVAAPRRPGAGFTMIELIVTLIVVGVLAVSVLPRFDGLGVFDAAGYADQTQALLRYAQKTAIAQRRWVAVQVGVDPPTLCSQTTLPACAANCAGGANVSPLTLPGGAPGRRRPSTAVTPTDGLLLCFDAVGRPIAAGGAAPMSTAATLAISDSGTLVRTLTVEPETGHVH